MYRARVLRGGGRRQTSSSRHNFGLTWSWRWRARSLGARSLCSGPWRCARAAACRTRAAAGPGPEGPSARVRILVIGWARYRTIRTVSQLEKCVDEPRKSVPPAPRAFPSSDRAPAAGRPLTIWVRAGCSTRCCAPSARCSRSARQSRAWRSCARCDRGTCAFSLFRTRIPLGPQIYLKLAITLLLAAKFFFSFFREMS